MFASRGNIYTSFLINCFAHNVFPNRLQLYYFRLKWAGVSSHPIAIKIVSGNTHDARENPEKEVAHRTFDFVIIDSPASSSYELI